MENLITPVVIASITTVLLSWVKEFVKEMCEKKSNATPKVVLLTHSLEKFSLECACCIADLKIYLNYQYDDYMDVSKRIHFKLPTFEISIENSAYKEIEKEYISQMANLELEIKISQVSIDEAFEIDSDDGVKEYIINASVLGYIAWTLSQKMRRKYDLFPLNVEKLRYNPIEEILIPEYQKNCGVQE